MSRIDDLIRQMCPDGVEYRALGEIVEYAREKVLASELDARNFVGVDNLLHDAGGRVDANYGPNTGSLSKYYPGDILIGNIRPYLKKIWLADRIGGCSGDVLALSLVGEFRKIILPRFLYYLLSRAKYFQHMNRHARGGKMPRGDKRMVLTYRVPIPPLEIQYEIVRVLDQFTQLEAELEAELEARRDQYAYALQEFLSFDSSVPRAPISSLCLASFSGGTPKVTNPSYYGGDIPWLRTQEVNYRDIFKTVICITRDGLENSSARIVPAGSVVVAISGAGVTRGRAAITRIELATNQHCCALIPHPDRLVSEYLYYWIVRSYGALRKLGRGNRSDLTVGLVKEFEIPVPPVSVQNRVASQLGRFDALVNDLSSGLPAEIAARRKQYEHYRDRLLTFPEMRS